MNNWGGQINEQQIECETYSQIYSSKMTPER